MPHFALFLRYFYLYHNIYSLTITTPRTLMILGLKIPGHFTFTLSCSKTCPFYLFFILKSRHFATSQKPQKSIYFLTISESRLLTLLRGQSFHRLQVKVVVQMQVVQILAVNEEIQHVVSLSTNLETSLHPI